MSESIIWAGTLLAVVAIICLTALSAWRGWLRLKRLDSEGGYHEEAVPASASRIEMADMKERLRKLEAIARGVDP